MAEWDRDWGDNRNRGRQDNDWNRGRRDNDWNRGRGWGNNNNWDWNWDKKYKHKKRKFNHYYGYNDAWWYPYWNQWFAPVVNPIFSWFAPYPTSLPTTVRPGVYW